MNVVKQIKQDIRQAEQHPAENHTAELAALLHVVLRHIPEQEFPELQRDYMAHKVKQGRHK